MGHLSGCMGTNGNSRWLHGDGAPARSRHADRWCGIERPYTGEDVERLRGSVHVEQTLARRGAERLWELIHRPQGVRSLGALTGNQAVQQVKAGLEAIYLSGWQVAADANLAGQMYPDQSLYPADSVPHVVRRINQALTARRPDPPRRGAPRDRLVRADRRRRRGGLRRRAERLRAHEGDDRGGRRGRALRGPARVREEVRAHGRQGAAADRAGRAQPHRRAARRRRARRPDDPARADRRRGRGHDHERRRPRRRASSSPASAPRRASTRPTRASTRRSPAAWPTRPTPTSSGARRRPRTSTTRGRSPTRSTSASPASCSPTTAHPRSTGGPSSPRTRSARSRTSSRRWATASSS